MRWRRANSRASPLDSNMFFPFECALLEWATFQSGCFGISLGTSVKTGSPAPTSREFKVEDVRKAPRSPEKSKTFRM